MPPEISLSSTCGGCHTDDTIALKSVKELTGSARLEAVFGLCCRDIGVFSDATQMEIYPQQWCLEQRQFLNWTWL